MRYKLGLPLSGVNGWRSAGQRSQLTGPKMGSLAEIAFYGAGGSLDRAILRGLTRNLLNDEVELSGPSLGLPFGSHSEVETILFRVAF